VEARTRVSKEEGTQVVAMCKTLFLKWVLEQGRKEGDAIKEVFWRLAGGKTKGSPFVDFMDKARQELDTKLEALGFQPKRRERDRISEVNFRRLKAMLEAVDDEDSDWIDEVAGRGVKLGVDRTMPRVPLVFEEKVKWNLDFTDEEFRDSMAANGGQLQICGGKLCGYQEASHGRSGSRDHHRDGCKRGCRQVSGQAGGGGFGGSPQRIGIVSGEDRP